MFCALGPGLIIILPVIVFGVMHMLARAQPAQSPRGENWIRSFLYLHCRFVSGILLMRPLGIELRAPSARTIVYWAHIASPLLAFGCIGSIAWLVRGSSGMSRVAWG